MARREGSRTDRAVTIPQTATWAENKDHQPGSLRLFLPKPWKHLPASPPRLQGLCSQGPFTPELQGGGPTHTLQNEGARGPRLSLCALRRSRCPDSGRETGQAPCRVTSVSKKTNGNGFAKSHSKLTAQTGKRQRPNVHSYIKTRKSNEDNKQ